MSHFLYDDAARMYRRKRSCNTYKKLTHDVYLYQGDGCYMVRLFSTDIVTIYPEYQVLKSGGWATMRTAKEMNEWSATSGVYLIKGSLRITDSYASNGSLPLYSGLRIDNAGHVFTDDYTHDFKEVVRPEVAAAWRDLTRDLNKNVRARCAIGEFDEASNHRYLALSAVSVLDVVMELDRSFPAHADVMRIISGRSSSSPADMWASALSAARGVFLRRNNGYTQVEVRNERQG